jgi:hypothetical protein
MLEAKLLRITNWKKTQEGTELSRRLRLGLSWISSPFERARTSIRMATGSSLGDRKLQQQHTPYQPLHLRTIDEGNTLREEAFNILEREVVREAPK